MDIEFKEFKKIPRLTRECVITEKIDGTNGCIYIGENGEFLVGSRSRWITPEQDNYGFAKWCLTNKDELLKLGIGTHYGEWWGQGIQRKYDMKEKVFSLFNVARWCLSNEEPKLISVDPKTKEERWQHKLPICCSLVPVLWEGIFDTHPINDVVAELVRTGSNASPGFMKPEGIVIFHKAGNLMFKKTIEKDDEPKSLLKE